MEIKYKPTWRVSHWREIDGEYRPIWEEEIKENVLYRKGQIALLSAYFATGLTNYGAPPADLALALANTNMANAIMDLAAVGGEPWGQGGYTRKQLATNGTGASGQPWYINQVGNNYQANSDIVSWTATANWFAVNYLLLTSSLTVNADDSDAHLIAGVGLSTTRTLVNTDKLNASCFIGLSE